MATLTIRPNAAGTTHQWNAEGGDYTRVDEAVSDGDTTRLYTPTANQVSTFNLEPHTSESGTINKITVYINTRGLDPISNVVQLAIRTGGSDYYSSDKTYNNTSYHLESNEWTTNPATGLAWTWSDIDALEAGMKRISGGGQAVTQVYVEVDYNTASLEQEGFRWRGDDGNELNASYLALQDSNITRAKLTNTRLRAIINALSGDPETLQYQLEFRQVGGSSWTKVPLPTIVYTSELTSGGTAISSGENAPSEGDDQCFDDSSSTKWLKFSFASGDYVGYRFGGGATYAIQKYSLTSGNDAPDRDPYTWKLQGSNDGSAWTDLDTRTAETFGSRGLTKEYTFTNNTSYEYYRLYVTAINGGSIIQLAELSLYAVVPNYIEVSTSSYISSSGDNTTAQLNPPSGKTLSDFVAGRMQDDENPADTVDIGSNQYTELEWCIQATNNTQNGEQYEFRITKAGTVLDTYSLYPTLTIGESSQSSQSFNLPLLGAG